MRRVKKIETELPKIDKIAFLDGDKFIKIQSAAKLAGVHPAVLEMGQRLIGTIGQECGVFALTTKEHSARAEDIRAMFVKGLKKVVKALGPPGVGVKSVAEPERLVFWYAMNPKYKDKA